MTHNRARRDHAFEVYTRLGPARSLRVLAAELHAQGHRVGLRTLEQWSRDEHWQQRLAAIEHAAAAELDRRLVDDRVERLLDQAELGRSLQRKGLAALETCPPEQLKPEVALRMALQGSELERAAMAGAWTQQDQDYRLRTRRRQREAITDLLAEFP